MMTDAELAFKTGTLFNQKITAAFWESFKGECGRVQAEVLVYLFEHEKVQSSEIVEKLNISKQHVSKIIRDFTEAGYVEMVSNEQDRRSRVLSLTKKGRQYLLNHFESSNASFESLLSQMEEKEKQSFLDAMETVSVLLSKYPL